MKRLLFALAALSPCSFPVWAADEPVAPTEITSNELDMWSTDEETNGVFTLNVVVTGTNLKITCDRLEVIATRIGDKAVTVGKLEKFKYLLATGRVHIVQGDREANCGRAEVFPREDKIVLTENPVVIDKSNGSVAAGDRITMLRGQRRVQVDKPRVTLPEIKDLGFDKNTPPPPVTVPPAGTPVAPVLPSPTPAPPTRPNTAP